ncbi:gp16 family protein [Aestuariivirga sp. YIM B02566]|uniref:Regulatory protein GemA n=1 Tax=Taklimakanibacter albus TaxID=2800327 RepID=A0ACC5R6T2_9HYPH|nr:regulatory protein GemA [Aestuariivirga sp. YIM B02566]MBK1868278.1 regulatory protein GemA [Aestuariivirga sp. YIM B02566]
MIALAPRNKMLAKVHVAKKELGLDDETYRDMLVLVTGKNSARDCSDHELVKVIELFGKKGFHVKPSKGRMPGYAEHKYAPKIRALWLSGWNLGIIRDPEEKAMWTFIHRQTGIASVRWLKSSEDALRVIEALKKWLAREGNVDWSKPGPMASAFRDFPGYRIAVAQWLKLIAIGAVSIPHTWTCSDGERSEGLFLYGQKVLDKSEPAEWSNADWVTITKALGRKLRKALQEAE